MPSSSRSRAAFEVRLRATPQGAELTVKDTGVGVPPEELPKLFERFHRIEGQKSRTHEGSGIGLALILELVRLHHGKIHADSRLNEGTTFTVTRALRLAASAGRSDLRRAAARQ